MVSFKDKFTIFPWPILQALPANKNILLDSLLCKLSNKVTATFKHNPKHEAFLSSNPWGKGSGNKSSKNELTANSQSFNGTKNF